MSVRCARDSAIVGIAFDFFLKYGADEACIISRSTGQEVCGHVIDRGEGEEYCVLSDKEGWICA